MDKKEKQNRIKELLMNALLPKEVKDILNKNLSKYSEEILDGMLDSLARGEVDMARISNELLRFDTESQKRWDNLEVEQLKAADDFVEQSFKELTS